MRISQHVLVFLFMLVAAVAAQEEQQQPGTCETTDEMTCRPDGSTSIKSSVCNVESDLCQASETPLYSHGGSAQAYIPNAPVKDVVCETTVSNSKHKVATWPFSRSTRARAPKLFVKVNLWSCSSVKEQCCCETLLENTAKAEVWQAQPDGTYSSLQHNNGDCRATILPQEGGQLEFTTMAPGSTGILGGLGPGGWDAAPYGQPTVHMLLTADNHDPLLIHVPILFHAKTLEERSFWGGDWRAHSGYRKSKTDAFKVTSWTTNGDDEIRVELDVFLTRSDSPHDVAKELCPSFLYGLPSSFFVEPIAVCAPSLLNFFPL